MDYPEDGYNNEGDSHHLKSQSPPHSHSQDTRFSSTYVPVHNEVDGIDYEQQYHQQYYLILPQHEHYNQHLGNEG